MMNLIFRSKRLSNDWKKKDWRAPF